MTATRRLTLTFLLIFSVCSFAADLPFDRAALRWVKLGHQQGGLVEVLAGLSPGDSVRIAGAGL